MELYTVNSFDAPAIEYQLCDFDEELMNTAYECDIFQPSHIAEIPFLLNHEFEGANFQHLRRRVFATKDMIEDEKIPILLDEKYFKTHCDQTVSKKNDSTADRLENHENATESKEVEYQIPTPRTEIAPTPPPLNTKKGKKQKRNRQKPMQLADFQTSQSEYGFSSGAPPGVKTVNIPKYNIDLTKNTGSSLHFRL